MRGKEDHEDKVECPVCANVSEVRGGVKAITTNFVYVKLVEHLRVHEKLTSDNPLDCGKCVIVKAGEKPNNSVAFCYECQAPLCEFCQRMHKQTVDLAGHHISSLEEIKETGVPAPASMPPHIHGNSDEALYVCTKHRDPLKWYCFTCEEVICSNCTVSRNDHRDHSFEFIAQIIDKERASLFNCLKPLGEMKETITKCSNLVRAREEELERKLLDRQQKIDSVVKEASRVLELRRDQLQDSALRTHGIRRKNLNIQLEGTDLVKGSVDSAIEFTRTTIEKGSDVEVMMYKKEILARSGTLEEMIRSSYSNFEVSETDATDLLFDMAAIEDFGRLRETPCVALSEAAGEGLECPMQDEETTFTVQARDGKGKPLLHGGSKCSAEITITPAPTGQLETIRNSVVDNQDGSYTVTYRPRFPGVNKVAVKFDNQDIQGSPYDANVIRNYCRPIGVPSAFSLPNASPWGLAMVSDTEMVVTASDCVVHVYNINGKEVDTVQSNFTRPYGVYTDHSDHLWVTDREAHMVQKFYRDSNDQFVKIFQFGSRGINAGQFSHPRGIAVNPDNNYVYISDMKNNRIQIFKPQGNSAPIYVKQFGTPGKSTGQFNLPAGLCFNKQGQLVVCDDHNCRLQVFDAEGTFVETLGTTRADKGLLCSPIGIAMDFHGRYVITEFGSHCVTFLSPTGSILNCVRSVGEGYGQFVHPRGIALDSAGYVYIADNENMRIARF
jgi:DNA-binding beta-propeller fold protein YncE